MNEVVYSVWLTLVEGVGSKTASLLVDMFESAQGVFRASFENFSMAGVSPRIADNIIYSRGAIFGNAQEIVDKCDRSNIRILVKGSVDYPTLLGEAADAPLVLYVRGNLNMNFGNKISIVGTRNATSNGVTLCRRIVEQFKDGVENGVVVSGLAYGIDKCAHAAALEFGLPTIAVMPGWVDDITPSKHYFLARQILEKGGAIVSDMPPGTVIQKTNFLSRNRIIAALSKATIVVQSSIRGGSMVTADLAFNYNREVFTPTGDGSEEFAGNVNLLKTNKAMVYESFRDVVNEVGWASKQRSSVQLDNIPEVLIESFSALPEGQFCLEEVADILDINIIECSRIMTKLEILGLISSLHGRLYIKN